MATITKVKKSRKEFKCSKCGKIIPVGSSYIRGSMNFSHDVIRCTDCGLKQYELTTSDYISRVGEIVEDWRDVYGVDPEGIAEALREIQSDCEERLENMPEGLQEGDTGQLIQDRIDCLDEAANELDYIDINDMRTEATEDLGENATADEIDARCNELIESAIDDALCEIEY